ncbi:MAG: exopolysaccharide biosynthesis polyprenyl glycosylphosphotransferase [Ignavibacteriaceae bacterium]|nr:exopolysaccharide biosynthesis polyprenyl glycosylphosphotransferase [Ignavibacteria bacterium]NNJ52864.1 exopolysaccharide biosynthesis polyprenyl glycosylphosphotransferase [Ignavibacteriaceae bacterium]
MIVNKKSIFIFRLLSDLLLLNGAFLVSAIVAQSWEILLDRNYMFFLLISLNLIWVVTSNYFNLYDDFNSRNFPVQFVNILKNSIIQILATVFFIFLVKEDLFTRYFIVYYAMLLVFFICLRVILFRKILKYLRRRGKNIRNLMIVGEGKFAENFETMIGSNPDFGYDLKQTLGLNNDSSSESIKEQMEYSIKSFSIDEVVIAFSDASRELIDSIIKTCNNNAVKVHIIPDYLNFVSNRFQLTSFGDFPIITVRREPLDEVQWRIVKRSFDLIFSLFVIVFILIWMIPLIFILSTFLFKSSVWFIQKRIGTKNKKFNCYKFRTMLPEIEPDKKFKPVIENDPRVTKFGRFLRKSNLDELPQFINVLKGEMSVVGPRPHAVSYNDMYGKIVDEIRLRHNVKPGITGWAQIHGLRGDVPDEEENTKRTKKRIEYDIWYIENWSFTLDLQIILLTIWKMLKGKTEAT